MKPPNVGLFLIIHRHGWVSPRGPSPVDPCLCDRPEAPFSRLLRIPTSCLRAVLHVALLRAGVLLHVPYDIVQSVPVATDCLPCQS